jgi:hypothetical protein
VDPVPPSPESQEDEVDREDDEISVASGSQERAFLDEEDSDHPTDSQTVKRVPSSGSTNIICRLKIGRKPFRFRRRGKRYFPYVPHEGVDPRP